MWNGRKCDEADGPCDNVFELCVKQFPPLPTSSSNNNCLYYFHTSDLIAKIVDFEHESTGIDKDIKLNFTAYTVNLTFLSGFHKYFTCILLVSAFFPFLAVVPALVIILPIHSLHLEKGTEPPSSHPRHPWLQILCKVIKFTFTTNKWNNDYAFEMHIRFFRL